MENVPVPKLADVCAITISTSDLERSLGFYQKLDFREVLRFDFPFPWIQITDGALLIMLRHEEEPYIALTYYAKDVDKTVATLESEGIRFITKPNAGDMIKRAVMQSPDGLNISLVSYVEGFRQPVGNNLLDMPQADFFDPEKYTNKACGIFGEFAHPVADLEASIAFWMKLGFQVMSKMTTPYSWAIITDGIALVGLHQTSNFKEPAITYFAVDMKEKAERLNALGLTDMANAGGSNYVLTTPEGQHINLFKLGM